MPVSGLPLSAGVGYLLAEFVLRGLCLADTDLVLDELDHQSFVAATTVEQVAGAYPVAVVSIEESVA